MKSEYICETCGKRFHTPEQATACEKSHEVEKKRSELKEKSAAVIGEMIEKHIKTFKEFPEVKISDEATELIAKELNCNLHDALSMLVSLFD